MIKQSECQSVDEDIRGTVSDWKTSELDKIHKYWLRILTSCILAQNTSIGHTAKG